MAWENLQGEALGIALGSSASACGQQFVTWDGTRVPCSLETPDRAVLPSTVGSEKMAQSSVSSHKVLGAPGSHLQALWFSQPPISSDGITDHRGATFLKFLFLGKKWLPCHDP